MRRIKVNEWQEWFHAPEMTARFADADLAAVASELGYSLSVANK